MYGTFGPEGLKGLYVKNEMSNIRKNAHDYSVLEHWKVLSKRAISSCRDVDRSDYL